MTSASQVPRLLALVPYLQAHPDADLAQTASVFAVTQKQLVADLKVLWVCGLPGGAPGDLIEVDMDALEQGRIRLTNADFLDRPLRLDGPMPSNGGRGQGRPRNGGGGQKSPRKPDGAKPAHRAHGRPQEQGAKAHAGPKPNRHRRSRSAASA